MQLGGGPAPSAVQDFLNKKELGEEQISEADYGARPVDALDFKRGYCDMSVTDFHNYHMAWS
jgi:hypothetical protein